MQVKASHFVFPYGNQITKNKNGMDKGSNGFLKHACGELCGKKRGSGPYVDGGG